MGESHPHPRAPHHPVLHNEYCINRRQRLRACHVCREVCPAAVYQVPQGHEPKWENCLNCGLCSAQCPARCITPSKSEMRDYLFAMMEADLPTISCGHSSAEGMLQVSCVGAIPWEYLAYLSVTHNVVLYTGECEGCLSGHGKECVATTLGQLEKFHGGDSTHVIVPEEAVEEPQDLRVRSSVFLGATKRGQDALAQAYSDIRSRDYGGLVFRKMLADLLDFVSSKAEMPVDCVVDLPQPNERCYGCGICADICPHGALRVETEGSGEAEGSGRVNASLQAWKCVGCGTCAIVCRRKAMEEPSPRAVPTLRSVELGEFFVRVCSQCGRPLPPEQEGERCVLCLRSRLSR